MPRICILTKRFWQKRTWAIAAGNLTKPYFGYPRPYFGYANPYLGYDKPYFGYRHTVLWLSIFMPSH
jgi:hypothetical protein